MKAEIVLKINGNKVDIINKGKNDNKSHNKRIGAFDDNNNLIKEYPSIVDAASKLKVSTGCISGVLRGRSELSFFGTSENDGILKCPFFSAK